MIDNNDFAGAQTTLENLIAEHEATMPNDHSIMHSELEHMKHALKHLPHWQAPEIKSRLTRILEYEPEQES